MKRLIIIMHILAVFSLGISAENGYAVKSSIDSARYEIVQSPLARKVTIKLDKQFGRTYQLARTKDDKTVWSSMYAEGLISDTDIEIGKCNYQIFLGGIVLRDCFLININTGKTWMLAEDKDIGMFWSLME